MASGGEFSRQGGSSGRGDVGEVAHDPLATDSAVLVARMMRVQERSSRRGGGRSRRRIVFGWDVAAFSAVVLALLSVGLGSWWTTQAIMASDPLGTLLRFVLSASAGIYYIVMFDTAWRHGRLGQGRLMQGMRGRLGR